ncbi:hypothetical protein M9458_025334, partial [Cirrhinus mrigala]
MFDQVRWSNPMINACFWIGLKDDYLFRVLTPDDWRRPVANFINYVLDLSNSKFFVAVEDPNPLPIRKHVVAPSHHKPVPSTCVSNDPVPSVPPAFPQVLRSSSLILSPEQMSAFPESPAKMAASPESPAKMEVVNIMDMALPLEFIATILSSSSPESPTSPTSPLDVSSPPSSPTSLLVPSSPPKSPTSPLVPSSSLVHAPPERPPEPAPPERPPEPALPELLWA